MDLDSIKITGTDSPDGFACHLDFSLPFIATAIHAGHHVREDLIPCMEIDDHQRKFEEDTGTDLMINGLSNAVWGLESRAVYDLNRSREIALPLTPERFWGIRVYNRQPTEAMNQKSLAAYDASYRFMETHIASILDRFGICIIYDIHSYNISRQIAKGIESPPVFNLGTGLLDKSIWGKTIGLWLEQLGAIALPGIKTTVAKNKVFCGRAEFCRRLSALDKRILVLPTEISKIYMDEIKGDLYPDVTKAIKKGLETAILSHLHLLKKENRF